MKKYVPAEFEPKWQKQWRRKRLFSPDLDKAQRSYYALMMFPYPSAEGLHVGNMYPFTGTDIFARFKRFQGFNVLEPIGLDGFGIHSENYALKVNQHPWDLSKVTEERFYNQLMMIGDAYDWTRTVETYKPNYYKWTQWLFLQMYKNDLAYRKKAEVNWCPSCKTVLADEQVIAGECERCGSAVAKRDLEQWFFRITKYADKLLKNLDWIEWSEKVKTSQRNWIGKSEGALIKFPVVGVTAESSDKRAHKEVFLQVFTTRPDTVFGATFVVISLEHPLLAKLITKDQQDHVGDYVNGALTKSKTECKENQGKTGVFTGSYVKNLFTGEDIPVWVADYVLTGYGTGAIMAVPAHDQRDFEFAKKFSLDVRIVIAPEEQNESSNLKAAYEGEGKLTRSGNFSGLDSSEAREKIISFLEENGWGKREVHFHLRDWLISRQRYWGPPIPIIYCGKCGTVPVPEVDLPVELPKLSNFRPTGTGQSPLAQDQEFVNVKCPKCKGEARRETDVSDTFLDSSWYFLRYPSAEFDDRPFDNERTKKWLPVNVYIGGAEHSVLHLLYSRFVTMVLHDLGYLEFEEPFKKFFAHGLIIKEGAKMSKSKGNVINPDKYIKEYGADTLRIYLMFMGPFAEGGDFRDAAIGGVYRFLTRVWELMQTLETRRATPAELSWLNRTIKQVTEDIEHLRFNTAISSLMILTNLLSRQKTVAKQTREDFLKLLAPFAPHITEELWQMLGNAYSIHQQSWPQFDKKWLEESEVKIAVQVDGKVRDELLISKDTASDQAAVEKIALEQPKVQKFLNGKPPHKVVYIPGRIISLVSGN